MTKAPLIGITTYHKDERGYVQLPAQYAEAVRRAGGIPLLIQPGEPRMEQLFELLDAMVLSGGGDVDPALYQPARTDESGHEQVYWVNRERDDFEVEFTRQSLARELPLFCICRGLQVLNVTLGGTLITHIPDAVSEAIPHRQPPRDPVLHEVALVPESRLAAIMGTPTVKTASWHHQSIDQTAPGVKVIGRAADGVIEAVEVEGKPQVLAVQWHPELTAADDTSQQRLFDELVAMARANMARVHRAGSAGHGGGV